MPQESMQPEFDSFLQPDQMMGLDEPITIPLDGVMAGADGDDDNDSPSREPVREIGTGTVLRQRYMIERAIGSGGSSIVFSALDRHRLQGDPSDGKIAVKILHPTFRQDQRRVQRLIREFRYMQRLTHPAIARVFDLDCDDGVWFITMELFQGEPLNRYLHRHGAAGLATDDALRILIECSEALACAHEHGVVHGDLKPSNVFIDESGAAHLLDFGSVPESVGNAVPLQDVFVTPSYASPQLLRKEVAELRDDLYSLGCVAYELFSGRHPFAAASSVEAQEQNLRPTWVRSIPARHFGVIARMMAWEREDRPASARELLASLVAAQERAKAAYVRPRPVLQKGDGAEKPDAVDSDSSSEAGRCRIDYRESCRAGPSPDVIRAFSEFAGVVPENWMGPERPPGLAPPIQIESEQPPVPVADPPRVRWTKPIPAEWLEPALQRTTETPSVSTPGQAEEATLSKLPPGTERAVASPAAPPRRHRHKGDRRRSRLRASLPDHCAAVSKSASVSTTTPEALAEIQTAIAAVPRLRNAIQTGWHTLTAQLQSLHLPRVKIPVGASTSVPVADVASVDTSKAPDPSWIPQLHLDNAIQAQWAALRFAVPGASAPSVRIDGYTLDPLTWQRTAKVVAPAPEMPPAQRPEPETIETAMDMARVAGRDKGILPLASQWRSTLRAWTRAVTPKGPAISTWFVPSLPHWRELRRSIGSLTSVDRSKWHQSIAHWMSRNSRRWREAIPVAAIGAIVIVAMLMLHVSNAVGPAGLMAAEHERAADARLARLGNLPVALLTPADIVIPPPSLPEVASASVATASGLISFQSARIHVGAGQQMAVVNLRREKSTSGAAPVSWSISPGTAKPGVDYETPLIQIARFNDGQDVRTVFIPIKSSSASARLERRFTIKLKKTPGGPAFGPITETEIVIAGSG